MTWYYRGLYGSGRPADGRDEAYSVGRHVDDLQAVLGDLRITPAPLLRKGQRGQTRAILLRAAEIYHARYADPDGGIRATFEMIWISGWAPHASQQKPQKPGSAKMRLAEALRTIESGN